MIRAHLRLIRHVSTAIVLLGLSLCGAEVGVRVYEITQGKPICSVVHTQSLSDPAQIAVPSWLSNLEMKPHATAEVMCRDNKESIEIRTNSQGFRGPEIAIPKPADTYRIVVLGDETILAPEISEDQHFVHMLAGLLHQRTRLDVEVVNAAVPGACPLTEFLLFRQKIMAAQPDLVLLHYDWSDVSDDRLLRRRMKSDAQGTPLSCPHVSLQTRSRKQHPLDHLRQQFRLVDWGLVASGNQWQQQISEQTASSQEIGTNSYAWLRQDHPESDVAVTQSFRPIGDLARLSQGSFQLVVLTSPKPWQVSARCSNGAGVRIKSGVAVEAYYPNRAPFEVLGAYSEDLRLPYLDLSAALMTDRPETNFLRHAPRWSATGHRRVAEYLAGFLIERISGPWNSRYFQQEAPAANRQTGRRGDVQWASGVQER